MSEREYECKSLGLELRFNPEKGGVTGEKWRCLHYVRNPRNLSILEKVAVFSATKKGNMVV
jgi:hypothetical protein